MAVKNRKTFNPATELQKAWDWCWSFYCEPTTHGEDEYDADGLPTGKKTGEVRTFPARQSWLTATDLERRLRAAAYEVLSGSEYGSKGADAWGSRVRISLGGYRGNLLDYVRDWLRDQALRGRLEAHNFGRGHISGMRFRPKGKGLTEAESKTIEQREKRRKGETPIHFKVPKAGGYWGKPLCVPERKRTALYRSPQRSSARLTSDKENVTCPRCKKLLEKSSTPAF